MKKYMARKDVVKIFIGSIDHMVNVDNMKLIIWAAGGHAQYISTELELEDIAFVVDRNLEMVGKEISLYGKRYVISSIDILQDLSDEAYFILIASEKYYLDITEEIKKRFSGRFKVCRGDEYHRVYSTLCDMFLHDILIYKKAYDGHITGSLMEYMDKINTIIRETIHESEMRFFMLSKPKKIAFVIEGQMRYVAQLPIRGEWGWRVSPRDECVIRSVYQCKRRLGINKDLNLYEDESGIRIDYLGDPEVDFSDSKNIYYILADIRKIHQSKETVDISVDIWNRVKALQNILLMRNINPVPECLAGEWMEEIHLEVENYTSVLCHGDFHHGNVITFHGHPEIIDWETMCMSDPMYDICRLFFYIYCDWSGIFSYTLEEWLENYYQRKANTKEICHARAILIYCIYVEYMLRLMNNVRDTSMEEKMGIQMERFNEEVLRV